MEGAGSVNEVPRPPLRAMVMLAVMAFLIAYETNPDFQSWTRYQLVKARAWVQYGREWIAYKQRQRRA